MITKKVELADEPLRVKHDTKDKTFSNLILAEKDELLFELAKRAKLLPENMLFE